MSEKDDNELGTMLDKAYAQYQAAETLYKHLHEDPEILNIIGFHLQQAVEMTIKFQLDMQGISYPKVHDIDQLIRTANLHDAKLILSDYVDEHSEMLSTWETKSRYYVGYFIEERKVICALTATNEFLKEVAEEYSKDTFKNLTNDKSDSEFKTNNAAKNIAETAKQCTKSSNAADWSDGWLLDETQNSGISNDEKSNDAHSDHDDH